MDIQLKLTQVTRAPSKKAANGEWLELINEGGAPFNGEGCSITVAPKNAKGRPRTVTTIKAGLVVQPQERIRLVSGSPGKKSQGEPPSEQDSLRNHHLFLKVPYIEKPGMVVRLVNRQLVELCRIVA